MHLPISAPAEASSHQPDPVQLAPPAPPRSQLPTETLIHHTPVSALHSLPACHLASSSKKQTLNSLVKTVRIKKRILGVVGMAE